MFGGEDRVRKGREVIFIVRGGRKMEFIEGGSIRG